MKEKILSVQIYSVDELALIDVANALFSQKRIEDDDYREFVKCYLYELHNRYLWDKTEQDIINQAINIIEDKKDEVLVEAIVDDYGSKFDDDSPSELRSSFLNLKSLETHKEKLNKDIEELELRKEALKKLNEEILLEYATVKAQVGLYKKTLNSQLSRLDGAELD